MGVSSEKNKSTTEELFRSSPLGSKSSTLTAYDRVSSKSWFARESFTACTHWAVLLSVVRSHCLMYGSKNAPKSN